MQAFRKMHSTVLEDAVCFVRKDKSCDASTNISHTLPVKTADKDVDFSCKLSGSDKDKFKAASALGLFIYFLLKFLIF